MRRLIDALGLPLNRDAAVCLYAALVCDTGRFQYETTTPEVFDLARELAEFDVPIAELSRTLFEEHRFAYLQLLGEVLGTRRARAASSASCGPRSPRTMLARHGVDVRGGRGPHRHRAPHARGRGRRAC